MIDPELLARLRAIDTPTVCNALEQVAPERTGVGFTRSPLVCNPPAFAPIVGLARTAHVRAAAPSRRDPASDATAELAYYRYMAGGPSPTVAIVEDLDDPPGVGAWWGEVNTHLHRGLGLLGVVTNGSVRDLDQLAEGFPVLAGSVAPSHAFVHVVDFGEPVAVAGMKVAHDDLVHADRHGAVVIPHALAGSIPPAAAEIVSQERTWIETSRAPGFGIEALERLLNGAADPGLRQGLRKGLRKGKAH